MGVAVAKEAQFTFSWLGIEGSITHDVTYPKDMSRDEICRRLDAELHALSQVECAFDVCVAQRIRVAEQLMIWTNFGYPSLRAYLEYRFQCTPRVAADRIRVARALGELPQIEQAVESGAVPWSAARELARVATGETQQSWLSAIRGKSLRDIERMVSGLPKGAKPDDPKDPSLVKHRLDVELSASTAAIYRDARAALSDEMGRTIDDDEAIAIMARRAMGAPGADGSQGAQTDGTHDLGRASYQISVTVCESCKRGWQLTPGAEIELEPAALAVAQCDAQHIGSVTAPMPERAYQDVTPAVRRLVFHRDGYRCQTKGCRSGRCLDIHHIEPKSEGGSHEPSNLIVLCSGCHHALHEGKLVVDRSAEKLQMIRVHELREAERCESVRFEPRATISSHADTRHAPVKALKVANRAPSSTQLSNRTNLAEQYTPDLEAHANDRYEKSVLRSRARDTLVASGFSRGEAGAAVDEALEAIGTVPLEKLLFESFRRCRKG